MTQGRGWAQSSAALDPKPTHVDVRCPSVHGPLQRCSVRAHTPCHGVHKGQVCMQSHFAERNAQLRHLGAQCVHHAVARLGDALVRRAKVEFVPACASKRRGRARQRRGKGNKIHLSVLTTLAALTQLSRLTDWHNCMPQLNLRVCLQLSTHSLAV